ncbi:MAG: hypothetical protein WCL11_16505 [Verrucomicrobiota bacterium]
MSSRERVIELLNRLPADTPLDEIARDIELTWQTAPDRRPIPPPAI